MAKAGYIGNSSSATVGNILCWSRGYPTAAAGVWGCQCHAVNKPGCKSKQYCKPKPRGQRQRLLYGRPVTDSDTGAVTKPVCIPGRNCNRLRDERGVKSSNNNKNNLEQ